MMDIEKINEYLSEISEGTPFFLEARMEDSYIVLYITGDNPAGEDWQMEEVVANPDTREELIEIVYGTIRHLYESFDVDEEVYIKLEAKFYGGVRGIPDAASLVYNEEFKQDALEQFSAKLYKLLKEEKERYEQ